MSQRISCMTLAALILGCGLVLAQAAAAPKASSQPKTGAVTPTPWGDPDLQGNWTSDNAIGVPFERPPQYAGRALLTDEEFAAREKANATQIAKDESEHPESPFQQDTAANNAPRHWLERGRRVSRQTSLVIEPADGRLPPLTPEGERRRAQRLAARASRGESDSWEDHSNYDRCITRGVTGSILPVIYGNGTSIFQAPGFLVIRNEMIHEARIVPLKAAPHAGSGVHLYMGDPRGHFEGGTLVIESTNFTDRTGIGLNGNGAMHSDALKLTERFTRIDADTLRYEFTVDDPKTYVRPWTVGLELTTKPGYQIYEYACHEGNYGLRNMLSAARADERK